jgi:hypothetical protein
MARHNNPFVTTTNLLLNLDFANSKRFTSTLGTNLVQDSNYNPATWGVYATILTPGIDAPDGSKNAVRMTSIVRAGTYTLTSNVATITITNHGLTSGIHFFDFTSGTGVDGGYNITVVNANTITIPVTAANGSGNVTMYVRTGLRVNFTAFTPNGTNTFTASFWVRRISTSFLSGSNASCDLADGNPSTDYTSQLINNQWVQVIVNGIPTATAKSFFDLLSDTFGFITMDFWGLKIENQTTDIAPLPLRDTVGNYTFNVYRPQYSSLSNSTITFNRTASTPKWGGVATTTGTGALTAANFLYNNHTWEIWFRIDDRTPSAYDANEGLSVLSVYQGYHAGLMYDSSTMYYYIWNGVSTMPLCANWTVGTSGAQINQGSWHQIVVVRSGIVFTPYINGAQLGTGSTNSPSAIGIGTNNTLAIGASQVLAAGAGSFVYYGKNTVANMKMYNRALTANEITQNFNALRGRFGI